MLQSNIFYEDRLIAFAGKVILFCNEISNSVAGRYLSEQLIRSAISSALNYGEARGTRTEKDFKYKASLVIKELKEAKVALKILINTYKKDEKRKTELINECDELIAIVFTMIKNKSKVR